MLMKPSIAKYHTIYLRVDIIVLLPNNIVPLTRVLHDRRATARLLYY